MVGAGHPEELRFTSSKTFISLENVTGITLWPTTSLVTTGPSTYCSTLTQRKTGGRPFAGEAASYISARHARKSAGALRKTKASYFTWTCIVPSIKSWTSVPIL